MKQKLSTAIIFLTVAYFSIGVLLYFGQRSFLYFPSPVVNHDFETLVFNNSGESINVIVGNKEKQKAILYFGGNAESVVYNMPIFTNIFQDHTIYLVNYRGYGGSSGSPKEKDIFADASIIFEAIKKKHSEVSVIGRSLGSGIATFLAPKIETGKLVLITPFDSIQNVAQHRFFIYPMFLLLKDKYDSFSRVASIKAKTLILIAENDEVIGSKHSDNLVNAFPASQIIVKIIPQTGHNTISENEDYYQSLKEFL